MRRIVYAVVGLCLAWALPACCEQWSQTFAITGKADLRVETSDANIHLRTWDQNTIQAQVTTTHYKIGEDGIQIFAHQTGDLVELEVRFPDRLRVQGLSRGLGPVDIDVQMPREGHVNLHTGDGFIAVKDVKGVLELASGDGRQDIDGIDGTLQTHAVNAHIHAAGRFDGLEVATGVGHVDVQVLSNSTVNSNWTVEAGKGNITLQVPSNLSADLALEASHGRVMLELPVTTAKGRKPGRTNVEGKINGGGSLVTVRTSHGSVRLEKL